VLPNGTHGIVGDFECGSEADPCWLTVQLRQSSVFSSGWFNWVPRRTVLDFIGQDIRLSECRLVSSNEVRLLVFEDNELLSDGLAFGYSTSCANGQSVFRLGGKINGGCLLPLDGGHLPQSSSYVEIVNGDYDRSPYLLPDDDVGSGRRHEGIRNSGSSFIRHDEMLLKGR